MLPHRRKRLLLICFIVTSTSLAVFFALYALKQNVNLYFTPTQISAGLAPVNHSFRLGGIVQAGSIQHLPTMQVRFVLTDRKRDIPVIYNGVLPDLFGANQGIVALGQLQQGVFVAEQVLAKHGAKYMPKEVQETLQAVNNHAS